MAQLPEIMPTGGQVVAVVPQSVEEIFRVSKGVVQSGLAPYALTGKLDTQEAVTKAVSAVAIVIMAGAELGLPPMVSLRSFTAINGRPALYGDGLINVVRRSGRASKLKVEYTTGTDFGLFMRAGKLREPYGTTPEEIAADTAAIRAEFLALPLDQRTGGYCDATRADTGESKVTIFTTAQAKRAGLWQDDALVWKDVWSGQKGNRTSKREQVPNDSPWYRYPERMLGWRAAGFCLRELFGDVLGGITDDWEAREIAGMVDVTPAPREDNAPKPPDPEEPPKPPEPTAPLHKTDHPEGGKSEVTDRTPADDVNDDDSGVSTEPTTPDDVLDNLKAWLDRATDDETVEQTWDELDIESEFAHDVERMGKAIDLKSDAHNRINRTAAGNNGQAELALSGTPAAGEPGEGGQ